MDDTHIDLILQLMIKRWIW